VLAGLVIAALAHYAWSLTSHQPFVGYDVDGHLQYIATLIDEGRLPHPMEGWSSFHPPFYYLLLALVSWPWAPLWPSLLLESISAASMLLTGALAFIVVRGLGHTVSVASTAAALCLFLPCAQLSATMLGNEALGAAFAALAAAAGVRLHADPRSARFAAAAGLAVGLALATKFTGFFALPALVVPFLRRDFDRDCLRAAAVGGLLMISIAGAPYARNFALTGSPVPMTRDRDPVARIEQTLTIRERRLTDYLWLDPAVFREPVVHRLPREGRPGRGLNPAMTNVWGLTYASAWYDAHEIRVADDERAIGVRVGRWLLLLGILPTALMLLGAVLSLRDLARRRPLGQAAPLVGMAVLGGLVFVVFTARAPAAAAVKASYLLPLAVPGAVFFARGACALGSRSRRLALAASMLAALAAAVLFTNGVVFETHAEKRRAPAPWMSPGLGRVAASLEAASAGRWLGIRAEPSPGSGIVWQLLARSYPALRDAEVSRWCEYIGSWMQADAPDHAWRAMIVQGADQRRCPPPSRILQGS
jgi:4-amino-4-deoxy-L-arabinose transferase-like glycosyltransferase